MKRRRRNPLSEENIKRIDSRKSAAKQTHGFQVYFSRGGDLFTKFFSDSLCGGKSGALRAARAYRDKLRKEIPGPRYPTFEQGKSKSNSSGYFGISYRTRKNRGGSTVRYISMSVRAEKGRNLNRQFRYTPETHDRVLKQALALRKQILEARIAREAAAVSSKARRHC